MFDNYNPYTLRMKNAGGITRYFVSFKDGEGINRETEVSRPVYLEFLRFIRVERNLHRWDERHLEQSALTEEMLCIRALYPQKSVEETVYDSLRNELFRLAIKSLSEVQRRRFVLHHELGLTYLQIAEMEGCTFQAVALAVKAARKKIRNYFRNRLE